MAPPKKTSTNASKKDSVKTETKKIPKNRGKTENKETISAYSMSIYLSNLKHEDGGFNRKAQNYCACLVAVSTIVTEYYVDALLKQARIEKRNRAIKKCIAEFKKKQLSETKGLTRREIQEYTTNNFQITNKQIQEAMNKSNIQINSSMLEQGILNNQELLIVELKASMKKKEKMRERVLKQLNLESNNVPVVNNIISDPIVV